MRWNTTNVKFTCLEKHSFKCFFRHIKFPSSRSSHYCSILTKTEMRFFHLTGDVVMLIVVQMALAVRWHRCLYQWLVYILLLFQLTGDVVMLIVVQMTLAVRWHRCLYQWLVYILLLFKEVSHFEIGSFSCHHSRCGPPVNRREVTYILSWLLRIWEI